MYIKPEFFELLLTRFIIKTFAKNFQNILFNCIISFLSFLTFYHIVLIYSFILSNNLIICFNGGKK